MGAPVALLTIVAEDRQFLKSAFGLAEPWASQREMSLSDSFCQYAVRCPDPLVIADAREDPRLRDNRAVADLGAIAYVGIPLRSADGHELGTLCVIDHRRRDWRAEDIALLRDIADTVTQEIHRQDRRPRSRPPQRGSQRLNDKPPHDHTAATEPPTVRPPPKHVH